MSQYVVRLQSGLYASVRVEADDESDAIEKAFEEVPGQICAQCSGWGTTISIDQGDWETQEGEDVVELIKEGD